MRYIQVRIGSFDLTEGVVKDFGKGASELCQKGVRITILTYRFFLRLTELVLGITDLLLFILRDLPQRLRLLLQLFTCFLR